MVYAPIPSDNYVPWFSEVRTGLNIIYSSGSQIVGCPFFSSGTPVSEADTFLKKPLSTKFDHTKTVTKLRGKKGT